MSTERRGEVFEVQKRLDLPWYALQRYEGNTFKANVRPFCKSELDQLVRQLAGLNQERYDYAMWLRDENTRILNSTDKVAIILDGRAKGLAEGFIGDMIEASRMVNVIKSAGKDVIIATPHPDLFLANHDPSVRILPLPKTIQASHTAPWSPELLGFLQDSIGDTSCFFPMNAATPAFIQLGADGVVQNTDSLSLIKEAFRTNGKNPRITPMLWGKYGIHQLQAFQINAYMLGIESAENWQQFPKAFLRPSPQAREVAQEVVKIYGCFESESEDCPPLYLHPGTATNGSKLITKFYPEDKWADFINLLSTAPYTAGSLTFLEPTEPQQAAMTLRLASIAIEAGLRVAKVPMAFVKQKYEWTLGSFIAFLQELSRHRGIMVGCDSMPAGHAGPATGSMTVVLGSHCYNPGFYCPPRRSLVVLPSFEPYTSSIEPERVVKAMQYMCKDPQLQQFQ